MTFQRIDHTAVVVTDLDASLALYQRLYDIRASQRTVVPEQRVEVAFLPIGDTQLELIQPTDDSSGVARFLRARGEGLHHIGIRVDDIHAELSRLLAEGAELIDASPRQGVHGLIAFVHPRTSGILIELVQPTPDAPFR